MSTSPVSPEDIRAAAEVHKELGPEYSDAVVAAFIDRVDREVAARVEARLASTARTRPARYEGRSLLKGMAIGVCAGALTVAGVGLAVSGGSSPSVHQIAPRAHVNGPIELLPYQTKILPRNEIPAHPGR
ncbi:MAG TPA: hypothetical protein VMA73_13355 [Streptosporangiaceae bacterium]|jgi:hypothetical protein|nr:hypothetical protein [Streptosporangiaceae bacterium]